MQEESHRGRNGSGGRGQEERRLQGRPEIGWYHSYDVPAFDLGNRRNMVLYGFDMTLRF